MIDLDGRRAVVFYDPEIGMLRRAFVGLTGEADLYAKDAAKLAEEGAILLRVHPEGYAENDLEPLRVAI